MREFYRLYDELREICKEIRPYYDIDKIKFYSVYIWTKGSWEGKWFNGENLFDIQADRIVFYVKDHEIIEEAKPIIVMIQKKLKEIAACRV